MPGALAFSQTAAKTLTLGVAGVLLIRFGVAGYHRWKASRVSPEERERRRRAYLVARGKMGDATLVEMRGTLLFYCYAVRGVEYTASQDVAPLETHLPAEFSVSGPVVVRYDARNPANSIVVAEQWNGLRVCANGGQ